VRYIALSGSCALGGEGELALGGPVPDWPDRYREHLYATFETELTAVDGVDQALKRSTV
jgi:hypothetical protein